MGRKWGGEEIEETEEGEGEEIVPSSMHIHDFIIPVVVVAVVVVVPRGAHGPLAACEVALSKSSTVRSILTPREKMTTKHRHIHTHTNIQSRIKNFAPFTTGRRVLCSPLLCFVFLLWISFHFFFLFIFFCFLFSHHLT